MEDRSNNLLFVSYYFPPCGGSGVLRIVRFIKNMAAYGWHPFIVTVDERDIPKLSYGTIHTDTTYAGVGRMVGVERVRLRRPSALVVWLLKSLWSIASALRRSGGRAAAVGSAGGTGAVNRAAAVGSAAGTDAGRGRTVRDYHSATNPILKFVFEVVLIVDQMFEWAPAAVWRGIRFVRKEGIDVIFSSSPPWSVHIVGYMLKYLCGKKWVMDLRDPIFGIETREMRTKHSPWIIRMFYRGLESFFMRGADVVACNCEEIRRYYQAKYPRTRFAVITNSYDPDDFAGMEAGSGTSGRTVISHFGELYPTIRTPDSFLRALADVVRDNPRRREAVTVNFFGSPQYVRSKPFQDLLARLGIESMIHCHDYVPHDEVTRRMMESDVLLLLQPHRSTNYQIPAKLFEYIAAAKPVLAVAPHDSATANLIREHDLGVTCDPDDMDCIRAAVIAALDGAMPLPDSGVIEQFSARQMTGKLIGIMDAL